MLRTKSIRVALFWYAVSSTCWALTERGSFLHLNGAPWKDSNINCLDNNCYESLKSSLRDLLQAQTHHHEFIMWSSAGGQRTDQIAILLKRIFKNTPLLPSLAPDISESHYQNVSSYFEDWLGVEARETFKKGGYYATTIKGLKRLQVIVLNTALFCRFHPLSESDDPAEQWHWLDSELVKAQNEKNSVYLLMSVTPRVSNKYHDNLFTPKHYRRFLNITHKYSKIIKGQFGGYKDTQKFDLLKDTYGKSYGWIMTTPPFSRSARAYVYASDNYSLIDYIQYSRIKYNWRIQYRLSKYYNMSPVAFEKLEVYLNSTIRERGLFSGATGIISDLGGKAYGFVSDQVENTKNFATKQIDLAKQFAADIEEDGYQEAFLYWWRGTRPDALIQYCKRWGKCQAACLCKMLTKTLKDYVACSTQEGNLLLSGKTPSEPNPLLITTLICCVLLHHIHRL